MAALMPQSATGLPRSSVGQTGTEVISARAWNPCLLSHGHHHVLTQTLGIWAARRTLHTSAQAALLPYTFLSLP